MREISAYTHLEPLSRALNERMMACSCSCVVRARLCGTSTMAESSLAGGGAFFFFGTGATALSKSSSSASLRRFDDFLGGGGGAKDSSSEPSSSSWRLGAGFCLRPGAAVLAMTVRDGGGSGRRGGGGGNARAPRLYGGGDRGREGATSPGRVKDRAHVTGLGARSPTRRDASAQLGGRLILQSLPSTLSTLLAVTPCPLFPSLLYYNHYV